MYCHHPAVDGEYDEVFVFDDASYLLVTDSKVNVQVSNGVIGFDRWQNKIRVEDPHDESTHATLRVCEVLTVMTQCFVVQLGGNIHHRMVRVEISVAVLDKVLVRLVDLPLLYPAIKLKYL